MLRPRADAGVPPPLLGVVMRAVAAVAEAAVGAVEAAAVAAAAAATGGAVLRVCKGGTCWFLAGEVSACRDRDCTNDGLDAPYCCRCCDGEKCTAAAGAGPCPGTLGLGPRGVVKALAGRLLPLLLVLADRIRRRGVSLWSLGDVVLPVWVCGLACLAFLVVVLAAVTPGAAAAAPTPLAVGVDAATMVVKEGAAPPNETSSNPSVLQYRVLARVDSATPGEGPGDSRTPPARGRKVEAAAREDEDEPVREVSRGDEVPRRFKDSMRLRASAIGSTGSWGGGALLRGLAGLAGGAGAREGGDKAREGWSGEGMGGGEARSWGGDLGARSAGGEVARC